jgi:ATP-dependent exoDNAse (exonuclease V) beta subunit
LRQAQLADRLVEIDAEAALKDLLPLARNYLASDVFKRVEAAPKVTDQEASDRPIGEAGLWSELSFRLRRPLGILFGVIDKLLITRAPNGELAIEIIDFKTNRIAPSETQAARLPPPATQFAFDFEPPPKSNAILTTAQDYELQMQAYALAVHQLVPSLAGGKVRVTLHFLDPNVEVHLPNELLQPASCEEAIDKAMHGAIFSSDPSNFPVRPAPHCRMCNFLRMCAPGKEWVRDN